MFLIASPVLPAINFDSWILNMERRSFIKQGLTAGATAVAATQGISAFAAVEIGTATMPAGYVSVKSYGARGDGVTDDSAAVQRAFNSSLAVWFPAGKYLVGNLALRSGLTIHGEGGNSRLIQKVGSDNCVSANRNGGGSPDPRYNMTGVRIVNLWFEGQAGKISFNESIHLLNLSAVSDMLIQGCSLVRYVGDGIYLGSGKLGSERHNERVTIRKCTFDGVIKNNRNGITVIDGTDIVIDECTFTRTGKQAMPGAIDLEPNKENDNFSRIRRITISDCTFRDIGSGSMICLMLRPNDYLQYPARDIYITNCKGYGSGTAQQQSGLGITQNSWSSNVDPTLNTPTLNVVVSGCYFENVYRPFAIMATKGVRIENTTFVNSPAFGFMGRGDGLKRNMEISLKNVIFRRVGWSAPIGTAGLRLYGNDYVTLDGCTFEDCGPTTGGGLALNFTGTCRSSYIRLYNTRITSPTGRTKYGIRVYSSHTLTPSTNEQSGTTLSGCYGNDFRT